MFAMALVLSRLSDDVGNLSSKLQIPQKVSVNRDGIGDSKAIKKVGQALREGAQDIRTELTAESRR
jgi:hypothetical protein